MILDRLGAEMGNESDYPMGVMAATTKRGDGNQCPVQHASDNADPGRQADHACGFVTEQVGPVRTVGVVGHLDWTTADEFRQVIDEDLLGSPVIIDLTQAQLDSAGTGSLVGATLRSQEHSRPMVVVVSDPVQREVLDVVGLADIVPVVHSVDEAQRELDILAGFRPG
jgi:anti-anti-sigma factor